MNRGFKGVWIPREIWLRDDLSCVEKCLLVEIESLSGYGQGCFAGNDHLAHFLKVSAPTITRALKKMEGLGLIRIDLAKTALGTKRTVYPLIKMMSGLSQDLAGPTNQISEGPTNQNDETPTNQNDEYSNTKDISNTDINTQRSNVGSEELALEIQAATLYNSDDAFTMFYKAYPRHEGKADAEKAWKTSVKSSGFPNLLDLIGIVEARKRGEWNGKEKQFIPLPGSYLRGKRWEDEIVGEETEDDLVKRLMEESAL